MARNYEKGQQFDKYYRYLNNYIEKQNFQNRVNNLDSLIIKLNEIAKLNVKSNYEIKDKINLIQQYKNYIENPY